MSDKVFFDTNVLVYAFDRKQHEKSKIAKRLIRDYGSAGNLVISTQVLQEFYAVVTRVGKQLLNKEEAEFIVNDFAEFPVIQVDKTIIAQAMRRHQTDAFSFWDSLIVEAALQAGCTTLLSEDMQNARKISALKIHNPFYD